MVGSATLLLRTAYALFPSLTRGATKLVMSKYLDQAKLIPQTNGNLFTPVPYGNSVFGGWGMPGRPKAHRKYVVAGLAITALGLLFSFSSKLKS
jgi:hypothetical protein